MSSTLDTGAPHVLRVLRVKDYALEEYEAFYTDTPHGIALAAAACVRQIIKMRDMPLDRRPDDWTEVHLERLPVTGRNVAIHCNGQEAFIDSDGISIRGLAEDLREALELQWTTANASPQDVAVSTDPITNTNESDDDATIRCDEESTEDESDSGEEEEENPCARKRCRTT